MMYIHPKILFIIFILLKYFYALSSDITLLNFFYIMSCDGSSACYTNVYMLNLNVHDTNTHYTHMYFSTYLLVQ